MNPPQRTSVGVALLVLLGGCAVAPEHYVQITTNCRGTEESAVFRMPETCFETTCSGDSFLDCSVDSSRGRRVRGELDEGVVTLYGTERFGPSSYRLSLPKQDDDALWGPDCSWPTDDLAPTTPIRTTCTDRVTSCWAELVLADR